MIHIENIPHVLKHGITHSTSINSNPQYKPIGDSSIIKTRNKFTLKNGRALGDYIPFYFGVRTPMLYVIQKGYKMVASTPAEDIVYCISSVQKIIDLELDFVFTNGHAVDGFSSQYTNTDIGDIGSILDMNAIQAKYWNDEKDLDKKRRKEAEFLVLGDIAIGGILGYSTYNENAKNKIINWGLNKDSIAIRPDFYF